MSRDQNAGRSHDIKIGNSSFERVGRYLGTNLTNQNAIQEGNKCADWSHRMPAIARCKIFCLPVCYPRIQRLRYTELHFFLLFCKGVKLGQNKKDHPSPTVNQTLTRNGGTILMTQENVYLLIQPTWCTKFYDNLCQASTCFEHHVLIVRRANCIIQSLVSSHL